MKNILSDLDDDIKSIVRDLFNLSKVNRKYLFNLALDKITKSNNHDNS